MANFLQSAADLARNAFSNITHTVGNDWQALQHEVQRVLPVQVPTHNTPAPSFQQIQQAASNIGKTITTTFSQPAQFHSKPIGGLLSRNIASIPNQTAIPQLGRFSPTNAQVFNNVVAPLWQVPLRTAAQLKQTPIVRDLLPGQNLSSNPIDPKGAGKLAFGSEPLVNYQQRYKQGFQIPLTNAAVKGPASLPLFAGGVALDLSGLGVGERTAANEAVNLAKSTATSKDFAKALLTAKPEIVSAVSSIIKDSKSPVNTVTDFFNAVNKSGKAKEDLTNLMRYPADLEARGYSPSQIKKISATEYKNIVQNNIAPFEHSTFEAKSPIQIATDTASQARAEFNTLAGNMGKGGFKGLDTETQNAFQNWVNSRSASRVEGLIKNKEFSDLKDQGINGIFAFQRGEKAGRLGDLQNYFNNKFTQLKNAGVDLGYRQNYLPQLWNNSQDQIDQVFRSLGTNPSFTFKRIIQDYETGIAKGLTPRFTNVADLAGWYEQRANKALADKQFFNHLGKDGFIQPSGKAPQDWVTLDPDRFPKVKVNLGEGSQYTGVFKAPPELATIVNNYLRDPQFPLLNAVAGFASRAKNITLSFGVPNTAINFHGINILARHTLFGTGSNPLTRIVTASKYLINPGSAESYLAKDLQGTAGAVHQGLTVSSEDHTALLNEGESVAKSFGKKWNTVFERPLFNKMIPALKVSSYKELTKSGMNEKDAAKLVNNIYGGINWQQMGRNRDTQNLLRALILAPDWGESTLRTGGNIAKSLTPWGGATASRYRSMAATLLASYVSFNIANKLTSGHYAYENAPGHTFDLQAGTAQDGQVRYLRPYGTSVDFAKIPFDIAASLAKGDPSTAFTTIRNRLSTPLAAAISLLANVDYKGDAIYNKDKYGNPLTPLQSATGIGSQIVGAAGMPSFAQNLLGIATGRQGIEEGLTQAAELPVRYSNNGKLQKYQQGAKQDSEAQQQISDKIVSYLQDSNNSIADKQKMLSVLNQPQNSDLRTRVVQQIRDQTTNITASEKSARNLPVVQRATYIIDSINSASTIEQKQQILERFNKTGIMTKGVIEEMKKQLSLQQTPATTGQ